MNGSYWHHPTRVVVRVDSVEMHSGGHDNSGEALCSHGLSPTRCGTQGAAFQSRVAQMCLRWMVALIMTSAFSGGCDARSRTDQTRDMAGGEAQTVREAEVDERPKPSDTITMPSIALPLTLLAVISSAQDTESYAKIRDHEAGVIVDVGPGDSIRPGLLVADISSESVRIETDSGVLTLGFSAEAAVLEPTDTFYPDLALDDTRSDDMMDAIVMPNGPGYIVKHPHLAWGTPRTIEALQSALRRYLDRRLEGPLVRIGDISKRNGGAFPPHVSHQFGRDVDIGYVLSGMDADVARFRRASQHNLDLKRTWALIESVIETGIVAYVFMDYEIQALLYPYAGAKASMFQYPHGRRASVGIIRHWPGHADHFHVRFQRG